MSNASINYIVSVSTNIQQAIAADTSAFTRCVYLIDDVTVPLDTRYMLITASDYADYFASGTEVGDFASVFFAQGNTPADLMIGRWARQAYGAHTIFPDITLSALIGGPTDADFTLTDNAGSPTSVDLSATTTAAEVAAAIQAEIRTGTILTNAASAVCLYDAYNNRIIIINAGDTGSGGLVWTMSDTGGAGTNIFADGYLGTTQQYINAGDAENPTVALTALNNQSNPVFRYVIPESNATETNIKTDINNWVATQKKIQAVKITPTLDSNAKNSTSSGLTYELEAAKSTRTFGCYTEFETETQGEVIAAGFGNYTPISIFEPYSIMHNALANIYPSGKNPVNNLPKDLENSEKIALEAKRNNFITDIGFNIMHVNKTYDGTELRILDIGDYTAYRIQIDIINWWLSAGVVTYTNEDLSVLDAICRTWLEEANRLKGINVDYTINIPDASTISAATKASGTYTNLSLYTATIQSAISKMVLQGIFQF